MRNVRLREKARNAIDDAALLEEDEGGCARYLILGRDDAVRGDVHLHEFDPVPVAPRQFFQNRRQSLAETSARREELHLHGTRKIDHLFPEVPVRDDNGPVREVAFDGKGSSALSAKGVLAPPLLRYPVLTGALGTIDNETSSHIQNMGMIRPMSITGPVGAFVYIDKHFPVRYPFLSEGGISLSGSEVIS